MPEKEESFLGRWGEAIKSLPMDGRQPETEGAGAKKGRAGARSGRLQQIGWHRALPDGRIEFWSFNEKPEDLSPLDLEPTYALESLPAGEDPGDELAGAEWLEVAESFALRSQDMGVPVDVVAHFLEHARKIAR